MIPHFTDVETQVQRGQWLDHVWSSGLSDCKANILPTKKNIGL